MPSFGSGFGTGPPAPPSHITPETTTGFGSVPSSKQFSAAKKPGPVFGGGGGPQSPNPPFGGRGGGRPSGFCAPSAKASKPKQPPTKGKGVGMNKNRNSTSGTSGLMGAIATKQQGQASKEVVRAKARGSCILMSELPKAHAHFEKKAAENKKKKSLGNQILNQDLCKAVSDREKKTGNVAGQH